MTMSDLDRVFSQTCVCGCTFTALPSFTWHEKGCVKGKKHLAGALLRAKEVYRNKKIRIWGAMDSGQAGIPEADAPNLAILEHRTKAEECLATPSLPELARESDKVCKYCFWQRLRLMLWCNKVYNDSLPLAQRRPRRLHCWLPARYRDCLPEPPMLFSPVEAWENPGELDPSNLSCSPDASAAYEAPHVLSLPSCQKIKTQLNSFGLFRLYNKDSLPIIDPDTDNSFGKAGLSVPCKDNFTRPVETILHGSNPCHPYPNETLLLLGDWYWNEGHQKSQSSFRKLLDIIGHSEYHPEDVWNMNWMVIDRKLGSSSIGDETGTDCEWLDVDSGWKKSDIHICIPFHHGTGNSGSKGYVVKDFHYHSLVEIIWENVSDPTHHKLFHYEPYELCWHLPHKTRDVRVYGELYASESFLAAHRQLQDLLPENGCTLPQRIIGLMFQSDATHLTAFGTAKLWPLYVYMGNESKYMRCQPLSNLCSHAAYFWTICLPPNAMYLLSKIS